MRRLTFGAVLLILAGLVTRAEAVTIRDLIELSRAGLGDEVLIALIEVDAPVFNLDAPAIAQLKQQGVSEKVILVMLRSGRGPLPQTPAPPPALPDTMETQPTVVIQVPPPTLVTVQVPVAVPYAVPYYVPFIVPDHGPYQRRAYVPHGHSGVHAPDAPAGSFAPGRFINDGYRRVDPAPAAAPVYWGWGGKPRPDAWGQPPPKS